MPAAMSHVARRQAARAGGDHHQAQPCAPEIPTVAEALKIPDYEVDFLVRDVRAGEDAPRDRGANAEEIAHVIQLPDVKQKLLEQGGDIVGSTPRSLIAW